MSEPLRHPLLEARGVRHGFGVRGMVEPAGLRRPVQVHGAVVTTAEACAPDLERAAAGARVRADAIVSVQPGVAIGIVTADCVPVLLSDAAGRRVAAVHAGWRGLAAGVLEAAVEALRAAVPPARQADLASSDAADDEIVAAIGPHIGAYCYEVDAPVLEALSVRHPALERACRPSSPGHAFLDLGLLARAALERAGVARVGDIASSCTRCHPQLYHSYRRDGPHAGRLVHYICAKSAVGG